jgi:hypothetical protein
METLVIVAIITGTATVTAGITVALINFTGGRLNERKKLRDQIRVTEFSQRLQTLQNVIELIQRLKNRLRYFLDDQSISTDKPWRSNDFNLVLTELRDIRNEFDLLYARGVATLNDHEGKFAHDLLHLFTAIIADFSNIARKTGEHQLIEAKYLMKIIRQREMLSDFQEKYLLIRRDLIKKGTPQ